MAVEASEGGGTGTAGELRARAELEMKQEREMGGEIEHIACRDGDDNDGSGTDCSFVMVTNGGDSDARSDSSEKDLDMDARGGGVGAEDLLAANSGSSTFVDDERVEEGKGNYGVERHENEGEEERKLGDSFFAENEGKGDDVDGEEDDALDGEVAEKILAMPVELAEVIDESAKTDHAQKQEGAIEFKVSKSENEHEEKELVVVVDISDDGKQNQVEEGLVAAEDSKDEKDAVIEESNNKDEVVEVKDLKNQEQNQDGEEEVMVEGSKNDKAAVIEDLNDEEEAITEDLKNEEQNQVEEEVVIVADTKNEKERDIEYLNKEDEVIKSTGEQVSGETEIPYVQNVVGSNNEGLNIGAFSAQPSPSGPVGSNIELELMFDKSIASESAVTELLNKEVESVSEFEEHKKTCEPNSGAVESSTIEKEEADSASEIEDRRDINNEIVVDIDSSELAKEKISSVSEIEDGSDEKHEKCKDFDSLVRYAANNGVDTNSEVEESKSNNDEGIKDVESSNEEISSVFEIEDRRDDNHEKCEGIDSLARDGVKKGVDCNSEAEETKTTIDKEIKDVDSEIIDQVDNEVYSASEVGDRKIANDDLSNCVDCENENNSDIELHENLQIKSTPAVSDSEGGELNTSVEEAKQHNVIASLPKSEIEEKEHDSSIELIDEPVEDKGSASIVEECLAAEALSIGQSTESAKEFIISASQAEDSNREHSNKEWVSAAEAEVDKNAEMLCIASKSEPKEGMDLAPIVEEKQDLDASFVESNTEPIRFLASNTEMGDIQEADVPSVDAIPELVKEDVGSASKSEENQNAEALVTEGENGKRELKSATELADVVAKPVQDLEGIEDQRKDLKTDEQDVESSRTEAVNEKRDKSATELPEHMKIDLDKNLGEIEEERKELKSQEKRDPVLIELQEGNAAPSTPDDDGEKTEMQAKKYRLIKLPRFTQRVVNDERQAKITVAQLQVDEHTQRRDSLKAELDNMRKVLSDYFHKRDSANEEEKKAKALVNAKRLEMDSIQTVISKGKTAASFLDIVSQIHNLEHKMQHETISLKDEKKYLHELNQLKHERELHSFNKCSQLEIDEALNKKETAESSLRTLKKEFDILRSTHLKADEYLKATSRSYIDQFNKVKEHEQKWKNANELRQNAYKHLHGLKSDKMEHYWKYMDDKQAAKKYASSRDIESLERHCTEQVERIMRLWNEDDDFRKHYVESNANNTLRKFGSLDGRTPGPNDPKPVIPSHVFPPLTTRSSTEEHSILSNKASKPSLTTNLLMVRSKSPAKVTSSNVEAVTAPSREEFAEVEVEKKLSKEEEEQVRLAEEQARKEEELRKEREELELKEKLRMEQKAKAKEAEERKRRKAEKAEAKAEYKAQKEAELRELKRSKKEKKKDGASEKAGSVEGELPSLTETSSQEASQDQEVNNRTSSKSSGRRSSSAALNKYNKKVQPVPLPLRNRGKRKLSTWIWTLCVVAALIGLFFAGNYISFSVSWLNFGF